MDLGAGTFEEIWFRGILLYALVRILKNHKYGILLALIIIAVVFGSVHLLNSGVSTKELMLNALSAGAGGLLLGSVYLKSKNLVLPMFLYFIQDFSLAFFKPTFINQTTFTVTILQVVLYLIAALILIRNIEPQKWLDSEVI
ncbi:CPBP family intramembrane glutamic endopeptidase [Lactobacillus sp. ESL0677]|uniref:CPBP family intramembrane glutamic endopeptidase n=1 Tax=Lactobacillus sp. ESL0677 TaxID=2983208 RepID=UPI0023F8F6EC|nr:CPBP family intramembrane glutamic endopeptidase [Lactobacillus sp. ESL0677]WEV37030.1 CPBP family intramembrane metalloprotease [Lactobacillus sp. ESL0677]